MLTQERVRELFDYCVETGELVRKITTSNNAKKGAVLNTANKHLGYIQISIQKVRYYAHRLIWLWHYGYFPENGIDHINRDRSDNRIENLREVSQLCNMRNTGNVATNTSGVKGVCWDNSRGLWSARVSLKDKTKSIGRHVDFNEAVLHRLAAEQCLNWAGCDNASPAYKYAKENGLIK